MPDTSTLYKSLHENRFFYIPDDTPFPEGDFVVRSLTGKEIATQAMVVELFEITQDEAQAITRDQLLALTGKFKSFVQSTAALLNRTGEGSRAEDRKKRVDAALKMGKDPANQAPDAMKRAIGQLVAGVVDAAKASIEDPEVGKERMKDVAEALKQEGLSPENAEAVERLPEQLKILLGSEDTLKKVEAATQQLREAADRLTETLAERAPQTPQK